MYIDFEHYEQYSKKEAVDMFIEIVNDIYGVHFPGGKMKGVSENEYSLRKLFQINAYLFKHFVPKELKGE